MAGETSFVVDASQIRGLADDLRDGYREAAKDVRQVVSRGALNVKKDWQQTWKGLSYAPRLPYAINYGIWVRAAGYVEAEIGPDKNRPQGALGNLLEFGSVNNPPHPGGAMALAREGPKFENAIDKIAAGLLG